MRFDAFEKILSEIKYLELKGVTSQLKMAPPFRKELLERNKSVIKDAKKAAVMALFYPNKFNDVQLVFIVRKSYDGVHSGQIGFPGGKPEPEDANLEQTALHSTIIQISWHPRVDRVAVEDEPKYEYRREKSSQYGCLP